MTVTADGQPNIPPNNVGAVVGEPRREWFVREDKHAALAGPMTLEQADRNARILSEDEEKSGLAQLCTYVGADSRGGDPVKTPSELFVVYMYIRGKKTLGGRTAMYHSENELPPTV